MTCGYSGFSCKAESLGTGITSSILNIFSNTICFRDALDKSHKSCSDLTSIGGVVRVLSFRRVFLVGTDIFYLDI